MKVKELFEKTSEDLKKSSASIKEHKDLCDLSTEIFSISETDFEKSFQLAARALEKYKHGKGLHRIAAV